MYHNPNDLGLLILIQIIPKERTLNPQTSRKFIPLPWYKGVGGGGLKELLATVFGMLQYLETICVQWKAFDLLNNTRYIFWVVALLEACDVTHNGRHLGFYQELEISNNSKS